MDYLCWVLTHEAKIFTFHVHFIGSPHASFPDLFIPNICPSSPWPNRKPFASAHKLMYNFTWSHKPKLCPLTGIPLTAVFQATPKWLPVALGHQNCHLWVPPKKLGQQQKKGRLGQEWGINTLYWVRTRSPWVLSTSVYLSILFFTFFSACFCSLINCSFPLCPSPFFLLMDLDFLLPLLLQNGGHCLVLPGKFMNQAPQVGKLLYGLQVHNPE